MIERTKYDDVRSALYDARQLAEENNSDYNEGLYDAYTRAIQMVCDLESSCVGSDIPVAHWVYHGRNNPFTCSHCGSGCLLNYEGDYHESTRCPHCGAIMVKQEVPNPGEGCGWVD